MLITGRIAKVLELTHGVSERTGKEWRSLEFVFEYFENENDRYTDKMVLKITNEKIDEMNPKEDDEWILGVGHSVREYQGRYYNELRVYRATKVEKEQPAPAIPQESRQVGKVQGNLGKALDKKPTEPIQDLPF